MRHENEGVSNTNVCAVAGDAGFRYHYYSNVFHIFICMSVIVYFVYDFV